MQSSEVDSPTLILQLTSAEARAHFSSHALVSIVRLTVDLEINIVTSEYLRDFDVMVRHPQLNASSPTVSIISLLMVALYPVSGSMRHAHPSLTRKTWRTTGMCTLTYPISCPQILVMWVT
jgi:hypothetical protein